ncbi:MAG: polysaccharide biosynthesis/export family protein [Bacteroidales bacterium]|nr:polysaccharide biosynthesis/export family protein [Bacteroidales bacterium]
MKNHKFYLLALVCLLFASCATNKKISYFQDALNADSAIIALPSPDVRFRTEDKLSIIVNSKDPELTTLFNLPYVTRSVGADLSSNNMTGSSRGVSCYVIDQDGNIDFPVLGTLHIEGMTRNEVISFIKNELISKNLVNDPIVTVEYANLQYSIFGEVRSPGRYNINSDRTTLLEALSRAGDMTINGKRQNVMVLRSDSLGNVLTYTVDMTSLDSVVNSPVYYLCQNDMIYVEPTKKRARESTANGNVFASPSFWISTASAITTLISTILLIQQRARQ